MSTKRQSSIIYRPSSGLWNLGLWIHSTQVENIRQNHPFKCKTNPIFACFDLKMKISLKNKTNSNPNKLGSSLFAPTSRIHRILWGQWSQFTQYIVKLGKPMYYYQKDITYDFSQEAKFQCLTQTNIL